MDALFRVFVLPFSFRPVSGDKERIRSSFNDNVSVGFDEVPGFLESSKWEFGEFGDDRGHLRHLSIVLLDLITFFRLSGSEGGGGDGFGVENLISDGRGLSGLLFRCVGSARRTREGRRFRFGRNIL